MHLGRQILRYAIVALLSSTIACNSHDPREDRRENALSSVIDAPLSNDSGPDAIPLGPPNDAAGNQPQVSTVVLDSPPDAAGAPTATLSDIDQFVLDNTKWATSIALVHPLSLMSRTLADGTIVTDAVFADDEDLLGPAPPMKETLRGGTVNGVSSFNPEFPMAQLGEHYIAVFWTGDDGHPLLVALLNCQPDGTLHWAMDGVTLTKQDFIDKVRSLSPLWKGVQ